jgi:hypothetical protein
MAFAPSRDANVATCFSMLSGCRCWISRGRWSPTGFLVPRVALGVCVIGIRTCVRAGELTQTKVSAPMLSSTILHRRSCWHLLEAAVLRS